MLAGNGLKSTFRSPVLPPVAYRTFNPSIVCHATSNGGRSEVVFWSATLLILLLRLTRAVRPAPLSRQLDSHEIDGHHKWLAQRTAISLSRIDPALRWELNPHPIDVVADVVRPWRVAGDLDVVVHSTQ